MASGLPLQILYVRDPSEHVATAEAMRRPLIIQRWEPDSLISEECAEVSSSGVASRVG